MMEEEDIVFALLTPQCMHSVLQMQSSYYSLLLEDHVSEQRRLNRSLPVRKQRPSWEAFVSRTASTYFKRKVNQDLMANASVSFSAQRSALGGAKVAFVRVCSATAENTACCFAQ